MSNIVYVVETSENGVIGVFDSVHKAGQAVVGCFNADEKPDFLRALRHRAQDFTKMEKGAKPHMHFFSRSGTWHAIILRMEVK